MRPIGSYATLIFDCDGVILDSNRVKTEAFRNSALPFGKEAADKLIAYHLRNGGESRYRKFEHFITGILGIKSDPALQKSILDRFEKEVREGLVTCDIASGLDALRTATSDSRWLVVSGSDQEELRWLFLRRGITHLFDGGIFGSPQTKIDILNREISSRNVMMPALFLGDSRLDYETATAVGVDFLFVSCWTEFRGWRSLQQNERFPVVTELSSLIATQKHRR